MMPRAETYPRLTRRCSRRGPAARATDRSGCETERKTGADGERPARLSAGVGRHDERHEMTRKWEQAARRGDVLALRAQIASGANVDALDRFGQSALMLATLGGHLEAVEALIAAGANLDVTAKFGLSATMLAVVNGHSAVARALATAGADLRVRGSGAPGFSGKSAADLAHDRGFTELAHELSRLSG